MDVGAVIYLKVQCTILYNIVKFLLSIKLEKHVFCCSKGGFLYLNSAQSELKICARQLRETHYRGKR